MSDAVEILNDSVVSSDDSPSFVMKVLRGFGWVLTFVLLLTTFTLLKLPETRIKNYVQGQIQAYLAPQGIGFSAESGKLGIMMGLSYTFEGVTLTPPPPANPVKIDRIQLHPSMIGMIRGKLGGTLKISQGNGSLQVTGSAQPTANRMDADVEFVADQLDLGKLGIFPMAAKLQGSAILSGSGRINGDLNIPSSLAGDLKVELTQITIDQQTFMGFAVPKLLISGAKTDLFIDRGKSSIKTFALGKEGSSDDLIGKIEGNAVLGKQLESSTLNLQTRFRFSEKVLKAFILIDALLGVGKQPDGTFAFNVTGPLLSPVPAPIAP